MYSKCSFIDTCGNNSTENHKIIEWFELERTFYVCLQLYAQGHFSVFFHVTQGPISLHLKHFQRLSIHRTTCLNVSPAHSEVIYWGLTVYETTTFVIVPIKLIPARLKLCCHCYLKIPKREH